MRDSPGWETAVPETLNPPATYMPVHMCTHMHRPPPWGSTYSLLHHPFSPLSEREGAGNKGGGKERMGVSTDSLASVTSFPCIPGFVTLFQGQRAETNFPFSSQNSRGKMKVLQILCMDIFVPQICGICSEGGERQTSVLSNECWWSFFFVFFCFQQTKVGEQHLLQSVGKG